MRPVSVVIDAKAMNVTYICKTCSQVEVLALKDPDDLTSTVWWTSMPLYCPSCKCVWKPKGYPDQIHVQFG